MSGTINLSLSQQFDNAGRLLSGGRLYFYQAATTTPQNAYKDTALTLLHPNPITLDSSGRIPEFWLADGNIKFVLVNKGGQVQLTSQSTQVLGPSSGSGSGSTVDQTTIFQTGDVMWLDVAGSRTGWVRDNGRSIGSATSGASERANSDCLLLYAYLWTTYPDGMCHVNGGRGISAAADWAANKYITLPDKRGRTAFGLDDMGNAAASRFPAAVPFSLGNSIIAGSLGGEATRTLAQTELPAIQPIFDGVIATITPTNPLGNLVGTGVGGTPGGTGILGIIADVSVNYTPQGTIRALGSGASYNNTPAFALGTFYRKL